MSVSLQNLSRFTTFSCSVSQEHCDHDFVVLKGSEGSSMMERKDHDLWNAPNLSGSHT